MHPPVRACSGPRCSRKPMISPRFGFVWQSGLGEQNPLGRWMIEGLLALGPANATWEAAAAAGLILILAKLALIGFLIWVTPHLGRYGRVVLVAGTVAGCAGAATNVLVHLR